MKRILLASVVALMLAGLPSSAFAQRNIDLQPAWGPVGYELAYFYYLPDLNIYYDVENALFYLLSGGVWVATQYLPDRYRIYDLYTLYKVVINDEPTPWLNNKIHKKQFKIFQKDRTQTPIRYSHDSKYDKSKQNTNSWVNPDRGSSVTKIQSSGNKSNAKPSSGGSSSVSKTSGNNTNAKPAGNSSSSSKTSGTGSSSVSKTSGSGSSSVSKTSGSGKTSSVSKTSGSSKTSSSSKSSTSRTSSASKSSNGKSSSTAGTTSNSRKGSTSSRRTSTSSSSSGRK
ncbi:MAG: hypothetical protein LUB83_01840 [Prevotellaceae bacterium]|nr:hypothetical protein [Prevotellaceae bacterium]